MPMTTEFRIRQQGDRCLIVDLGDQIDENVGLRCLALADKLRTCAIDGVLDIVPSFISVAVYYEPRKSLGKDPAHALRERITQQLASLEPISNLSTSARSIDIPICYGGEHGP